MGAGLDGLAYRPNEPARLAAARPARQNDELNDAHKKTA